MCAITRVSAGSCIMLCHTGHEFYSTWRRKSPVQSRTEQTMLAVEYVSTQVALLVERWSQCDASQNKIPNQHNIEQAQDS